MVHALRHQSVDGVDARHVGDVAVGFAADILDFCDDGVELGGVGFDVVDADVEAVVG